MWNKVSYFGLSLSLGLFAVLTARVPSCIRVQGFYFALPLAFWILGSSRLGEAVRIFVYVVYLPHLLLQLQENAPYQPPHHWWIALESTQLFSWNSNKKIRLKSGKKHYVFRCFRIYFPHRHQKSGSSHPWRNRLRIFIKVRWEITICNHTSITKRKISDFWLN